MPNKAITEMHVGERSHIGLCSSVTEGASRTQDVLEKSATPWHRPVEGRDVTHLELS